MTLANLIRKRDTGGIATAIPAIPATQKGKGGGAVARIATVAVANSKQGQTAPPAKIGAGDTANNPMTPASVRIGKVISKLRDDDGLRYAVEAHDDIDLEAVILTLAIRGEAACELRIPKSRYDGFALMELIEKHTTRETLQ